MYFSAFIHLAADATGNHTCEALAMDNQGRLTAQCGQHSHFQLTGRQLTPQQRLWYRRFCHENRVPLLLWQEMHHNLSGIVYAETLDKHRQAFDSARGHNSPACSGGLQLTWLYALASHWGKQRFALQRFSLGRDALTLHVGSARVCRRYVLPLRDTRLPEGEAGRYLRLFMRDNRHWLQAWQNGDRPERLDQIENDGHAC